MINKLSIIKKDYSNIIFFSNNFLLYKLSFFNLTSLMKTGDIVYIKYLDNFNFLNNRFFIGFCFFLKKSSLNYFFGLRNNLKNNKGFIELIFSFYSPFVLELKSIKKYSQKFRLSKLYFFNLNRSSGLYF